MLITQIKLATQRYPHVEAGGSSYVDALPGTEDGTALDDRPLTPDTSLVMANGGSSIASGDRLNFPGELGPNMEFTQLGALMGEPPLKFSRMATQLGQ